MSRFLLPSVTLIAGLVLLAAVWSASAEGPEPAIPTEQVETGPVVAQKADGTPRKARTNETAKPFSRKIRFEEDLTIEDVAFAVPLTLNLTARTKTRVDLSLTGDLGAVQAALPALLSREIENTCDTRTAIAVTEVRAEGHRIRLLGQLQAQKWLCLTDDRDKRAELLSQTAAVDVVLKGDVIDGCLAMEVVSADIAPDGVTGAILDATGMTGKLTRDLKERLDTALNRGDACLHLPDEFRALDTRVTGGHFTDLGAGRLGAVLTGEMTVNARNFIRLMARLGRDGKLAD